MKQGLIQEDISNFLNLSRWFSAFVVIIGHVRNLVFPPFVELVDPHIFWKLFYFLTSFGHEAVMIFFVISGYLIGGEVISEFKDGTFKWTKYLVSRITRLYIVLIPALLITVFYDNIGHLWFDAYDRYFFVDQNEDLYTFFINLFMLQTSYGLTFGSNNVLWSLAYEFWYYLLFPLIVQSFYTKDSQKLVPLILIILIIAIIDWKIILYFSIWLAGVGTWYIKNKELFNKNIVVIFLFSVLLSKFLMMKYASGIATEDFISIIIVFIGDGFLGLMFMLLIYQFSEHNIQNRLIIMNRLSKSIINKKLADFSYSLYLYHFPFVFILVNFFLSLESLNFLGIYKILLWISIILIAYTYAYFLFLLTETHTNRIRIKIFKIISK